MQPNAQPDNTLALVAAGFCLGASAALLMAIQFNSTTPLAAKPPSHQTQRVDCSRVYVKKTKFGDGSFAAVAIKKGDLVESGIVRRIPVDGNKSEYVFTWYVARSIIIRRRR